MIPPARSADAVLRIAAGESNASPFAIFNEQRQLKSGIIRDLMDAYAEAIGVTADYRNLPRGRVMNALLADEVDVACFLNPAWVADPASVAWSQPLFASQQVIVSPPGKLPVRSLADLFGRRVGVILNYVYPALEPQFKSRRVQRRDAPTLAANLVKLEERRVDVVIDVDLAVFYAMSEGALAADYAVVPLWVEPDQVHCAFSVAFDAKHLRWREPLQAIIDDGRLQAWIRRYTGGRAPLAKPLSP